MNFTNNRPNRAQPYITWKGQTAPTTTTSSIVANNSRPLRTEDNYISQFWGRPNPIKHWRKQLIPLPGSGTGKVGVGSVMDRPGGAHLVKNDCCILDNSNSTSIKNYIKNTDSASTLVCSNNICNKQRITRSASTIVKKNYFTTNKEYLRNRVRLYSQNQTISPILGNSYINEKSDSAILLPPTNSNHGSQSYNSTNCYNSSQCTLNSGNIIYKPNNPTFSKQGAVSSSLRLQKIKYNEINKTAKNMNNPWGVSAANESRYRGDFNAPYINKSKFNLPVRNLKYQSISGRQVSGGVGHHTVCCNFPSVSYSELEKKNGSVLENMRGTGTGKLISKQNASYCDQNGFTNNNMNLLNNNRFLRNRAGCKPNDIVCKKICVIPPISEIKK